MTIQDKLKLISVGDAIVIRTTKSPISSLIRFFTKSEASHVAVYVGGGDNSVIEYDGVSGKCIKTPMKHYMNDRYRIWVRRIIGITVDQAEKIKAAAYNDLGKRYDYIAYIKYFIDGIMLLMGVQNHKKRDSKVQAKDKAVCSSGYDLWTKKAGIDIFPHIGDERVTPDDVLKSKKMKTLFYLNFSKGE